MTESKTCHKCKRAKPLSDFYMIKTGTDAGKYYSPCKQCHAERRKQTRSPTTRVYSYSETSMFLSNIAEKALSKFFDHIERMPPGNHGFDFLCGRLFKIDAKCSCLHAQTNQNARWEFQIDKNQIADYFLCLAFDNRESLTPLHVWVIPGNKINAIRHFTIANSIQSLSKWSKYERPLDKVIACCNKM